MRECLIKVLGSSDFAAVTMATSRQVFRLCVWLCMKENDFHRQRCCQVPHYRNKRPLSLRSNFIYCLPFYLLLYHVHFSWSYLRIYEHDALPYALHYIYELLCIHSNVFSWHYVTFITGKSHHDCCTHRLLQERHEHGKGNHFKTKVRWGDKVCTTMWCSFVQNWLTRELHN